MASRNHDPLFLPYVHAGNQLALGIFMPVICIVVMAIRLYVRRYQKGGIGKDDELALATLPFVLGMGVCLIAGVKLGVVGYPTPPFPEGLTQAESLNYQDPGTKQLEQIEFAFQVLMFFAYALVKLSIMYFYRRIFVVSSRTKPDIISYIIIALIICWFITFELLIIFKCGVHIDAAWGTFVQTEKYCHGQEVFHMEQAFVISDLILDLIVFVFPFPAIWSLHLDFSRKMALSGVFLVGLTAIVASILRLAYYEQVFTHVSWTVEGLIDSNLATSTSFWWSFLEAGLSFIAACLPSVWFLFTKRSMGSIIAGIRSAISLPSIRTQGSHGSKQVSKLQGGTHLTYTEVGEHGSSISQAGMVPRMVPDSYKLSEVRATFSLSRGSAGHSDIEEDAIFVRKGFSQVESAV